MMWNNNVELLQILEEKDPHKAAERSDEDKYALMYIEIRLFSILNSVFCLSVGL